MRVLAADEDDDDDTRQVIGVILEAHGAHVHLASNFAEARALLATERPQVVISDIRLPDGSGFEVARHVREQDQQIPCIALSGYAGDADRARAAESGFARFLSKPISVAELVAAIRATAG